MPDLPVGSTFADHVILDVAGRGGMGVVYRARHAALKREVALKVIAPELGSDPAFRARFRRECEMAASIQHPHVIPVYHAGEEGGRLYVTMRFVEGTDLSQILPLAPERAVTLIAQVAEGLDAAHRRGLVHRDVKPANVLIDGERAVLTDFGVSKDLLANTRHTDGFVGTFDYAAPEQFKDEPADARADVYALGCVLYESVSGRVPFPADSVAAKMFAHVQQPPPEFPGPLGRVIRRAMAKAPADRYASAGEFAAAAQAALTTLGPPPALTGETSRGPFVGRARELERLRDRLGGRAFVLITGEPGIGKSRLASEFADAAHAAGASILYGRCDSHVPYQPFITALQQQPLTLPPELGPELGRFIPALRHAGPEPVADDPELRRYRLFEAVTRALAFLARERQVVLILEDLHWADTSTLRLLAHLLNDPEPVRLLVLATARDEPQLPSSERIALKGLDAEETEALVRAHGGVEPARLHDRTAGNPFFIEELLRDGLDAGVPEGVTAMIARRLAQLDEETNQVLALAAVVGREFRLEVLEALLEDADVLSALERAVTAGLVRELEADRFRFAHALVRETLYESQSASRRVRAHHRIAGELEPTSHPAEVARHYLASRHLDRDGKGAELSARAGEAACAVLAYDEAVMHFRNAGGDVEVLLALGDAEMRAGDPAARETFARAAELAQDPDQLGRAALGFAGRHAASGLIDAEAVALMERALDALEGEQTALVATLLACLANCLHFASAPERTAALSERALAIARAAGDPRALALALESRHSTRLHPEYLPERLALGEEVLALATRIGDRELEAFGHHVRLRDLLEAGEVATARAEHAALTALATALRQPLYLHYAACWDAMFAHCDGDLDRAAADSQRAFDLGRQAQVRPAIVVFASQTLAREARMGVTPEMVARLEGMVRQGPALAVVRSMLALTYTRTGRDAAARELLTGLAEDGFGRVPRDMLWLATICVAAEACSVLADAGMARVLYGVIEPYRDRQVQAGSAVAHGSAERYLGLLAHALGDYELAAAHLAAALASNQAWGMAHVVPLVLLEAAQTQLALGHHRLAHELANAAIPLAEHLRMAPTVQKAHACLLDPIRHA